MYLDAKAGSITPGTTWSVYAADSSGTGRFPSLSIGADAQAADNNLYVAGNVGIGTTATPTTQKLLVSGTDNVYMTFDEEGSARWSLGNDSAPNNYFTISSGADLATERLVIDLGGNVGIGLTSPVQKLQVSGNIGLGSNTDRYRGNIIQVYDSNADFQIQGGASAINFIVANKASTAESFRISTTGNVGIGTTAPDYWLKVVSGATNGHVASDGTWSNASDSRIKQNVTDLSDSLDKVMSMRPISYDLISESPSALGDGRHLGFIAQEMEQILPQVVDTDSSGMKSISYAVLAPVLTQAIQQQQAQINSLIAVNSSLAVGTDGTITVPNLTADKLVINSEAKLNGVLETDEVKINSKALVQNTQPLRLDTALVETEPGFVDIAASLNSLDLKVSTTSTELAQTKSEVDVLSAQIASMSAELVSLRNSSSSSSNHPELVSGSSSSAQILNQVQNDTSSTSVVSELNLTPPETLLSTGSATLAELTVSEATVSGQLTAYQTVIQDSLKSLGQTTLGNTAVAGDFSVDGTLSLTGNSLSTLGELFIQNGPLADKVDIFNGLVTIDKTGKLIAQDIEAKTITTEKLTINTPEVNAASIGSGKLAAGETKVAVYTDKASTNSKVFITAKSSTQGQTPYVELAEEGAGFVVSIDSAVSNDIDFDWWIVETK